MAFTESVTAALQKFSKTVDYRLELKTSNPAASSWQQFAFVDFKLTRSAGVPSLLLVELCNDNLSLADESDDSSRVQLFAGVRLTAVVGGLSEVLFDGRIFRVEPRDYALTIHCQDWLALLSDCECEVSLAPDETTELGVRQLSITGGGVFGSVFGFSYSGAGDPAFNSGEVPGKRRRAWAAGDIRLWYDSALTKEVPPAHYRANLTSGTVSLLEDTLGNSYYASGVRCYIEGTLDWTEVFKAALQYPVAAGGIGLSGTDLDMPDTGIDSAGPVWFRGPVSELAAAVLQHQQQNLRLYYDSAQQKYALRIVVQQGPGSEDWQLLHPQSVSQPRTIRDLYSRVVVSGRSERPLNALADSTVTLTNLATTGDWFAWDGLDVGADSTFATVSPNLYDGDANLGAAVHNLPASATGGSDRYDSWYGFIEVDFGSLQRIQRVRVRLPGSRNINAAAGHQGLFWPGVRLLASEDGTDYRLLSGLTVGRFPPGELIEAAGTDILQPKARYVRVLLGAYKHGFDNHDDPSIGLAELELYTAEEYRVVREIDPAASPASFYSYTADYDGDGTTDSWQRNHPQLWQRFGQRHRTLVDNQQGNLNEFLAHDRALDLLAESVRLFQQVEYVAVCDPRIAVYDTVKVDDELNGNVGSILVEQVVLRPSGTRITGTNYLAGAL